MRSGLIAAEHDGPHGSALLIVKGAPGMVTPLIRAEMMPPDFYQVPQRCLIPHTVTVYTDNKHAVPIIMYILDKLHNL